MARICHADFASAALLFASATFTKPIYPLISPQGQLFTYQPPCDDTEVKLTGVEGFNGLNMVSGFLHLEGLGVRREFVTPFVHLREVSMAIERFATQRHAISRTKLKDRIVDSRTALQYELLSLPEAESLTATSILSTSSCRLEPGGHIEAFSPDVALKVYGACRLAALLYSVHMTFPMPVTSHLRLQFIPLLQVVIGGCDEFVNDKATLELLLWCTMVGAIFSIKGTAERRWFTTQTIKSATLLGLSEWEDLRILMLKFAWVTTVCDKGGKQAWLEGQTCDDVTLWFKSLFAIATTNPQANGLAQIAQGLPPLPKPVPDIPG